MAAQRSELSSKTAREVQPDVSGPATLRPLPIHAEAVGAFARKPLGAYSAGRRGRRGGSSVVFNLVPGLFALSLFVLASVVGLVVVQRVVPIEMRNPAGVYGRHGACCLGRPLG